MNPFRATLLSLTALAGITAAAGAQAQEKFPSRPITMIVPTSAGGGTDGTARVIAALAEPILGQKVVVINRAGAGGAIGMEAMLEAKPDGYTIAGVWNSPITVTPLMFKVNYDRHSYVPVELSDTATTNFCVAKDFPANTGMELIKEIKAHPDKYTYGTDGVSGTVMLTGELIFDHFGAKARPIPYAGAAQTLEGFTGHYIDIYGGSTALIVPYVKNGTAKCLITSTAKPNLALPGSSDVTDLGIPQDSTQLWHAIVAPAAIPKDRLAILEHAFVEAAKTDKFKTFAAAAGANPVALDSVDAGKLMNAEYDEFSSVVTRLGLGNKSAAPPK